MTYFSRMGPQLFTATLEYSSWQLSQVIPKARIAIQSQRAGGGGHARTVRQTHTDGDSNKPAVTDVFGDRGLYNYLFTRTLNGSLTSMQTWCKPPLLFFSKKLAIGLLFP